MTEFVQVLSIHPSVKRSTEIGALQPNLNIVHFVGRRVLARCQLEIAGHRRGHTLIIVRRALTEPKTALAGVMLATSFARFMASIATFNAEMVPSRPFGRSGVAAMVEPKRGGKKTVLREAVRKSLSP